MSFLASAGMRGAFSCHQRGQDGLNPGILFAQQSAVRRFLAVFFPRAIAAYTAIHEDKAG